MKTTVPFQTSRAGLWGKEGPGAVSHAGRGGSRWNHHILHLFLPIPSLQLQDTPSLALAEASFSQGC